MLSVEYMRVGPMECSSGLRTTSRVSLRTEEQFLNQANVLRHNSEAIIATDLRFIITAWNKVAEVLYGWSANEVIGHPITAVLPTTYVDDQPQQVLQQLVGQGRWRGEVIQHHKDGTTLTILASVALIKDSADAAVSIVAVNRDITSEQRCLDKDGQVIHTSIAVKCQRRAAEVRYRTLVERIPAMMYIAALDETSSTIYVSPQIQALLGFSQAEWMADRGKPRRWYRARFQ